MAGHAHRRRQAPRLAGRRQVPPAPGTDVGGERLHGHRRLARRARRRMAGTVGPAVVNSCRFGAGRNDGEVRAPTFAACSTKEKPMTDLHAIRDGLVVTAFWEAKPSEVDEV